MRRIISIFILQLVLMQSCTHKVVHVSHADTSSNILTRFPASATTQSCLQNLYVLFDKTTKNSKNKIQKITQGFTEYRQLKKLVKRVSNNLPLAEDERHIIADNMEQGLESFKKDFEHYQYLQTLDTKTLDSNSRRHIKSIESHLDFIKLTEVDEDGVITKHLDLDFWERQINEFRVNGIAESTLRSEDILLFSLYNQVNISKQLTKIFKSNFLALSPIIFLPAASIIFDGGITLALSASIKLAVGIKGMDIALDAIMDNATKFISKKNLVLLSAATTNMAEAGASQAAAISGDVIGDVASTPLGSNWVNLVLSGVAMNMAIKDLAIKKGFLRHGQRLTWSTYRKVFSWSNLEVIKKELGHATFFMFNALTFQFVIRNYLRAGNPIPMAFWLTVNVPVLFRYFTRHAKEASKEAMKLASEIQIESLKKLKHLKLKPDSNLESELFTGFIKTIEDLKMAKKKIKFKDIKKSLKQVQKKIKTDPIFRQEVERGLASMEQSEIVTLMKLTGIDTEVTNQLNKKEVITSITTLLGGITGVIMMSSLLDSGVSDLPEAIPQMDKSAAGFVIMAFFSSIGELLTTTKFFRTGQMKEGMQNISDSNAINIMLAQLAIATSFFSNGFKFKYQEEAE